MEWGGPFRHLGHFRAIQKNMPVLKEHLQLGLDTCVFTFTVLTYKYLFPFKFDENRPKFKRSLIALYVRKDSTIGYINKKEKTL